MKKGIVFLGDVWCETFDILTVEVKALEMYDNQIIQFSDSGIFAVGREIGNGTTMQMKLLRTAIDDRIGLNPKGQGIVMSVFVSRFGISLL